MGADFILYAVPACEITAQRHEILKQRLDTLADEELAELVCEYGDTDEARQRVRQAIDFLVGAAGRRDVADFCLPGMPYALLTTGGLSWGDFPTDAACEFAMISSCGRLHAQLEEWARHDLESMPVTVAPSEPSIGETL